MDINYLSNNIRLYVSRVSCVSVAAATELRQIPEFVTFAGLNSKCD